MPDGAVSPASATDGHAFYHVSKLVSSTEDHFIMSSVVESNSSHEHAASTTWNENKGLLEPWCRSCQESGRLSQLKLFQFNFEDALYMCTQENCQFPMSENNVEAYVVKRSLQQLFSTSTRKRKKSLNLQAAIKSKRLKQDVSLLDLNSLPDLNEECLAIPQINKIQHPDKHNLDIITLNKTTHFSPPYKVKNTGWTRPLSEDQNSTSSLSGSNTLKSECGETASISDTCSLKSDASQNLFNNNAICLLPEESVPFSKDSVVDPSKEANAQKEKISPHADTDLSVGNNCHNDLQDLDGEISEIQSDQADKDSTPSTPLASSNGSGCQSDSEVIMIPEQPDQCGKHELSGVPRNVKMIQWKNENNLCWLDTILLSTVNNSCVREALNFHLKRATRNENIFYRLCKTFDDCQAECNELLLKKRAVKKSVARLKADIIAKLHSIRLEVFNLLQTHIFLENGKDESIVELLPGFLKLDPIMQDMFSVQLRWELACEECNYRKVRRSTTTVVSFPSTCCDFHPLNASFSRQCFSCSAKDQRMNMIMEVVPPCLVMHFQRGLPHNRLRTMDFSIQEHLYCVTAVIQYVTNPFNHFVVWIRDNKENKWMCCDDLKNPICTWKIHAPKISPKQIHMIVWEKQSLAGESPVDIEDMRRKYLTFVTNKEATLSGDEEFPQEVNTEKEVIETIVLDEAIDSRIQHDAKMRVVKKDSVALPNSHISLKSSKTYSDFKKLPASSGRTRAKLISSTKIEELIKPKRNFKLAGYKKAKFKSINVFTRPYEKPSPTVTPTEKTSSVGSSSKLSDISDVSDLFFSDFNCHSNFSDGSVTTASQNSDARSFGDDIKRFVDAQFPQVHSTPPESSDGDNSIPFATLTPTIGKQSKSSIAESVPLTLTPTSTDLEDMLEGLDFDFELSKASESYPSSSATSSSSTTPRSVGLPPLDVAEDPFNFSSFLN